MDKLVIVNPNDSNWTRARWVLCFGAYGWTRLLVWADSLDDALDECVDWIADNAPGLLADEQVADEFRRLVAEGMSEEDAADESAVDTTCAGNCGNYLNSWEWGVVAENPGRKTLKSIVAECGGVTVAS